MRYTVILEQGENNWGAHVPDLPGCVAAGETRDEVLELIRAAIKLHIEGLQSEGLPVPEPRGEGEIVEVGTAQLKAQTARPKRRWITFLLLVPLVGLSWQQISNRPVAMSNERAIALTVNERRTDGLAFREFVEQRFRRVRCEGRDPGPIEFTVRRTEGIYEFVGIQANAWESSQRCSDPFAVVAGIPLSREFDAPEYPEYRGRLGKVVPADKGRDNNAEPTWLVDFRNGARP